MATESDLTLLLMNYSEKEMSIIIEIDEDVKI